jgi:hypothetical protein
MFVRVNRRQAAPGDRPLAAASPRWNILGGHFQGPGNAERVGLGAANSAEVAPGTKALSRGCEKRAERQIILHDLVSTQYEPGHVNKSVVGVWRLISWENRAADGEVTYPMGVDALGYLIYTADGRFAVMISRQDRPSFAGSDLLGGTTEEKTRAVEGFVAYGGRYIFHGDRVVHHVELSLFPNWVGTDQKRVAEFSEGRMTLSVGPLLLGGKHQVARLVWERIDSV